MKKLLRRLGATRDALYGWRVRQIKGTEIDPTVVFRGMPIVRVSKGARLVIGPRTVIVSRATGTILGVSHPAILRADGENASIIIGADTGISGGRIIATNSITIGNGCLFGSDVHVMDSDFHPVDVVERRYLPQSEAHNRPVVIKDNVFLGTGAKILKGVTIESGSVVGAGSVVTKNVDENSIVAGNPAQFIRKLRLK